ncbi:glycosyltransferase family 57 protein, partial [Peniophora sp. CONT]
RNVLAITYSLPLSDWYRVGACSIRYLRCSPFFAYFSKLLARPAAVINPQLVDLYARHLDLLPALRYLRATVVCTELALGAAFMMFVRSAGDRRVQSLVLASMYSHPVLVMVDHIRIQYNGFALSLLTVSIICHKQGRHLLGTTVFSVLVNFDINYLRFAPAYCVYTLGTYCMSPSGTILTANILSTFNATLGVFVLSFGPFVCMGQANRILSGLTSTMFSESSSTSWTLNMRFLLVLIDHAMYHAEVINYILGLNWNDSRFGDLQPINASSSSPFLVLPPLRPMHSYSIATMVHAGILFKLWQRPNHLSFVMALNLCAYTCMLSDWILQDSGILWVLLTTSVLAVEGNLSPSLFFIPNLAAVCSTFVVLCTEKGLLTGYTLLWAVCMLLPAHQDLRRYDIFYSRRFYE